MTFFLVVTGLMATAGTLWLIWPLRRTVFKKGQQNKQDGSFDSWSEASQDHTNLQILREELAALQADLNSGRLTIEEFESGRLDLQHRLLEEESAIEADAMIQQPEGKSTVAIRWSVGLGMPAMLVGLYLWVGMPLAVDPQNVTLTEEAIGLQEIQGMVTKLEARLAENPNDERGWHMLARSYSVLQRLPEAIRAYANALRLDPKNPTLLADYADLLAFQNQSAQGEPLDLILRALKEDPEHLKALSLAGTAYFERADFSTAAVYWSKALALVPADSEVGLTLRDNIDQAQIQEKLSQQKRSEKPLVPSP